MQVQVALSCTHSVSNKGVSNDREVFFTDRSKVSLSRVLRRTDNNQTLLPFHTPSDYLPLATVTYIASGHSSEPRTRLCKPAPITVNYGRIRATTRKIQTPRFFLLYFICNFFYAALLFHEILQKSVIKVFFSFIGIQLNLIMIKKKY